MPAADEDHLAYGLSRRLTSRRRRVLATGVTAAAVLAVAIPVAAHRLGPSAPSRRSAPAAASPACLTDVPPAVLPRWARTGFTGSRPEVAYLRSREGRMLAIFFAQPLTAPPSADHNNKILWVARPSPGRESASSSPPDPALRITARLGTGSTQVTRVVPGGPGPSIVDLPRTGCWHLTLRWAGRTDHLDLAYLPL